MSITKTYIEISGNENLDEKIRKATNVFPSKQQIAWQKMELTAFLHFGMNTFCDVEWGEGTADPTQFNPTYVDCDQWAKVLKQTGFKGMILTCKHHDGFCLWPSQFTKYTIKNSPYQNGHGDIVKQASDACKKYGLKFGIYLSPWDRHDERYGDSPEYNQYFLNQLTELLTNYGEIFEVWFDGACAEGANGKKQEYDWNSYYSLIRKLQPDAVISIEGPDVRWVGNEAGTGREEEWSVVPGFIVNSKQSFSKITANAMNQDIASNKALENLPKGTNCLFWSPAQVDTSIRPGWFYHSWENGSVKSLNELVNIYENSVGANAELLLNIPPDTDGKISIWDVDRLTEFGDYIKSAYKTNLMDKKAIITSSNIIIEFNKNKECNCIILEEDIEKGQRVSAFKVYTEKDGKKTEIAKGKTIGNKKIIKFPKIETDKLIVTIEESRAEALISGVGVYYVPDIICPPIIKRSSEGLVEIKAEKADKITYSINNSKKIEYTVPFMFESSGKITAEATYTNSYIFTKSKVSESVQFGILKNKWEPMCENNSIRPFIKGETPYTIFNEFPVSFIIDINETVNAKGIEYVPISNPLDFSYNVFEIEIYASNDNKTFTSVYKGTLDNIKNNPVSRFLEFNNITPCRYIKFKAISGFDETHAGIGTINLVTI